MVCDRDATTHSGYLVLVNSVNFIRQLMNFMEKWYLHLQTTSSSDSKEAWTLVCSAGKAIFRWLQEVRSPAAEALSQMERVETTTDILWASARCHKRMQELILADFRHHPVVATALNVHLFEHRVPLSIHSKLVARVIKLESEGGKSGSATDKLQAKLTKLEAENRTMKSGLDSLRSQLAELKRKVN